MHSCFSLFDNGFTASLIYSSCSTRERMIGEMEITQQDDLGSRRADTVPDRARVVQSPFEPTRSRGSGSARSETQQQLDDARGLRRRIVDALLSGEAMDIKNTCRMAQ